MTQTNFLITGAARRDRHFEEQMISIGVSAYYWTEL